MKTKLAWPGRKDVHFHVENVSAVSAPNPNGFNAMQWCLHTFGVTVNGKSRAVVLSGRSVAQFDDAWATPTPPETKVVTVKEDPAKRSATAKRLVALRAQLREAQAAPAPAPAPAESVDSAEVEQLRAELADLKLQLGIDDTVYVNED